MCKEIQAAKKLIDENLELAKKQNKGKVLPSDEIAAHIQKIMLDKLGNMDDKLERLLDADSVISREQTAQRAVLDNHETRITKVEKGKTFKEWVFIFAILGLTVGFITRAITINIGASDKAAVQFMENHIGKVL